MMTDTEDSPPEDCFLIMPISDPDGYDDGHFLRVYEDIFAPACQSAGLQPVRADEVTQTNLIHLDILQRLIQSPMALCDLSSRNPNVLFELGIRQAFDKPVVLVQEKGTPKIFDIAVLRITDYCRQLKYHQVPKDQEAIATSLRATREACKDGTGVNSIVNLLSLSSPAALKAAGADDTAKMLQLIRSEIGALRTDMQSTDRPPVKTFHADRIHKSIHDASILIDEASKHVAVLDYDAAAPKINLAYDTLKNTLDSPFFISHDDHRRISLLMEQIDKIRVDALEVLGTDSYRRLFQSDSLPH